MGEKMLLFTNAGTGLLLVLIGALLYKGKCGFLLAGWNTMRREKKGKWDEKRLLRFNGKCIIAIGLVLLLIGLFTFIGINASVVNAVGWTNFTVIIIWMLIYQNTKNRFKK